MDKQRNGDVSWTLCCRRPIWWGHYALMVCLSVRLSVCLVPDPNSRTEGRRKLKLAGRKPRVSRDPIYRSKGQRSRSPDRDRKSAISLEWPTNFKLSWYTDGVRWPASPTRSVTSNLKALVAVQVTTCKSILRRPHYRSHSLFMLSLMYTFKWRVL